MKNQKLDKQNVEDILGLSPMQEGILFHHLKEPDAGFYLEQLSLNISGDMKSDILKKACNHIVGTNEMLRTVFRWKGIENPLQLVMKHYELEINEYDVTDMEVESKQNFAEDIRKSELEAIDIEYVPMRVALIKYDKNAYEMVISNHHILYDGWSNGILLKELFDTYDALYNGSKLVSPVKNKYKEFIKWSRLYNEYEQEAFWKKYLEGIEIRPLQRKGSGTNKKNIGAKRVSRSIPDDLVQEINNFTKTNNITLAALLYSAWGILLHRYTNSDDVLFGITVSGRTPVINGIDRMIGLFINTLPLRVQTSFGESVKGLLEKVNRDLIDRDEFQKTPLVNIKSYSGLSSSDLFDTVLVIENYPLSETLQAQCGNLHIDSYSTKESANFDLVFEIMTFKGIELTLSFFECTFDMEYITRMLENFVNIIKIIIENPQANVVNIDILAENEKQRILNEFSKTGTQYLCDKTLHTLFEEQAERSPKETALVFQNKEMSYEELNRKSNSLARTLRQFGVRQDTIVGLFVENSFEMIIGMLGILKAGGAYLPLDPEYPADRIRYMLDNAEVSILLTQTGFMDAIEFRGHTVNLDDMSVFNLDASSLTSVSAANHLAYVIYTSGSTGRPAGVMVEHKAIVNTLSWRIKHYKFSKKPVVFNIPSFSFDSSVESIYTPLLTGGCLVLNDKENKYNIKYIGEAMLRFGVSHFLTVPDFYGALLDEIPDILRGMEIVTIGGEKCSLDLINKHFDRLETVKLYNEYGPTENSVTTTVAELSKGNTDITIGKPIDNVQCYILDKHSNLQPIGISGELCISGCGLARGYLNRDDLDAKRFVPNPFASRKRMYKTGDTARWTEEGNIEFLGRIDQQVKIRGYRIELGEIEAWISRFESVKDVVVVEKKNSGNTFLYAYIVSNGQLDMTGLKTFLSEKLPDYMLPSKFKILNKMPMSPNGKVDRKVLAGMEDTADMHVEYVAPRDEVEEKLITIWKKVLQVDKIGIYNTFFDIGGNSIQLMRVHSLLEREYPQKVNVGDLFTYPTVHKLAEYIRNNKATEYIDMTGIAIELPKEYFAGDSSIRRDALEIKYRFTDFVSRKMTLISEADGISVSDMLQIIFMYIFALITGEKLITIQSYAGVEDTVLSTTIDFEQHKDFKLLLQEAKEGLLKDGTSQKYNLRNISKSKLEKSRFSIIPFFYNSDLFSLKTNLQEIFDISIGVSYQNGQMALVYRYNNRRLRDDKAREFINTYIRYVEAVVNKYE